VAAMQLVVPVPTAQHREPRPSSERVAERIRGQEVVIVNNGWGSFDELALVIETHLRDQYKVSEVRHYQNGEKVRAASDEELDIMAQNADGYVVGLGNCGGCSAWSVKTSLELEKRGVLGGVVVTSDYVSFVRFAIESSDSPEHSLVILPGDFDATFRSQMDEAATTILTSLFGAPPKEGLGLSGAQTGPALADA